MFSNTWHILAFVIDDNDMLDPSGEYREFNGVYINDFNGGDPDELVISAMPTVAKAQSWNELMEQGSTTLDSVDIATFKVKNEPARFQTSELRIMAVDEQGRDVRLIISPGYEVDDEVNGFDDVVRYMG
jgi:hypothetical protein